MKPIETAGPPGAEDPSGAQVGTPPGGTAGGSASGRDVILFDGVCPLCNTGVDWVRARDRAGNFDFLPYQSAAVAARFPGLDPARLDAEMHLVTADGRVLRGVEAGARVLRRLPGWGWVGRLLAAPVLGPLARPAYRWLARRRRGLFAGRAGCRVGAP